jgi:hypothetical protein
MAIQSTDKSSDHITCLLITYTDMSKPGILLSVISQRLQDISGGTFDHRQYIKVKKFVQFLQQMPSIVTVKAEGTVAQCYLSPQVPASRVRAILQTSEYVAVPKEVTLDILKGVITFLAYEPMTMEMLSQRLTRMNAEFKPEYFTSPDGSKFTSLSDIVSVTPDVVSL